MSEAPLPALFILLAVLIVLSAFFSSSETGLVALNRYRMRHHANNGHRGARLAQRLLAKPDRMFGIILLGNNMVNIFAASVSTVIAIRVLGNSGILASTLALTAVILVFAEVAPKTLAALKPERIAYPASYVLVPLLKVLYPAVWLVNLLAATLLRPFGAHKAGAQESISREELRTLVKEEGRQISLDHRQMLINILDLEHGSVDDVMVPRQDIVGIDIEADWDEILQTLETSIFTRLPVWRGDLENVVGLLHIRSVLPGLTQGRMDRSTLEKAIRSPYYVPEGTPLTQQLLEFQTRERRLGLVVDEYGDIQGLITLDDILEEIVGEFTTERGNHQRLARKLENGDWIVDGGATVRMLNRRFDWDLPITGAKTLNGLMLEHLESLPDGRTSLRIGPHIFTIVDMVDKRIRKVQIRQER